jgi:hypothetical protein
MADWQFTDDYLQQYPALAGSALSLLYFSDHTITETAFTGTLDFAATPAFAIFGELAGVTSLAFTGTVTNANDTLTVSLTSSSAFSGGLATTLPLIGPAITAAAVTVNVVTKTTDDPNDEPPTSVLDLVVTFTVGSGGVVITAQIPMSSGFITLTGTFQGVGISLSDLDFLIKGGGGGANWFPSSQLTPYTSKGPSLELLSITLVFYITLTPSISVKVSSVTVEIGITNIPLLGQRLYLNPLAVVVTVPAVTPGTPATIGLVGDLALCNFNNQGHPDTPDAVLEVQMGLTDYSLSAQLLPPEGTTGLAITTLVSDLMGAQTDIGVPSTLTLTEFNIYTQADKTTGQISSFSTEIAMSGGFGLFTDFDIEGFDLALEYSA